MGWTLIGVMVFVGNFAAMLQVPDWVLGLSPLHYPAQVPVDPVEWLPLLALAGISLVGVVLGLIGLRRKQISARG